MKHSQDEIDTMREWFKKHPICDVAVVVMEDRNIAGVDAYLRMVPLNKDGTMDPDVRELYVVPLEVNHVVQD